MGDSILLHGPAIDTARATTAPAALLLLVLAPEDDRE
jgi:hypothetical protein